MQKIYIGGIHAVKQALDDRKIISVEVAANKKSKNLSLLLSELTAKNIPIKYVESYQIDFRLPGVKHQGIAAECALENSAANWQEIVAAKFAANEQPLILILDSLQDPHNLGACLRTALAADVDCVLIPNNNAAEINATVHQVSCGASEILPIFRVSNLKRDIEIMKERGIWIVGGAGEETSRNLYSLELGKIPLAVVVGNEANGIGANIRNACDYLAKIPMNPKMESLNVSVATAVLLYEIKRQRNWN